MLLALAGTGCAGSDAAPKSQAPVPAAVAALVQRAEPSLRAFYAGHGYAPLWSRGGRLRPEAASLLRAFASADRDGLDPAAYLTAQLRSALTAAAGGDPAALARADLLLSRTFAAYVADLHTPSPGARLIPVDAALAPRQAGAERLLDAAAAAPSLATFVTASTRVNPAYDALRTAAATADPGRRDLVRLNLDRLRALPADPGPRFILVDTAGARVTLWENGRAVRTMKAVVGKPDMATPALAALVRFEVLNPYWNIPPDLVRDRIAPKILAGDTAILARQRLEILSGWGDDARVLRPEEVDWAAVAAGAISLHLRQKPGGDNMMGRVKFMFPNRMGIYLHDTPHRGLFGLADRRRSSGCVRLEDAAGLAAWLFGGRAPAASGGPEQRVDLPRPVPVFITYLTAAPEKGRVVFNADGYGRDKVQLAQLSAGRRRAA